jgi:hypothetical protein
MPFFMAYNRPEGMTTGTALGDWLPSGPTVEALRTVAAHATASTSPWRNALTRATPSNGQLVYMAATGYKTKAETEHGTVRRRYSYLTSPQTSSTNVPASECSDECNSVHWLIAANRTLHETTAITSSGSLSLGSAGLWMDGHL